MNIFRIIGETWDGLHEVLDHADTRADADALVQSYTQDGYRTVFVLPTLERPTNLQQHHHED